jgi:hypothetical protein
MAQHDLSSEQLDQQTALSHLASGVGHHVINAFSAIVSNAEILRLSTQSGHPVDAGTIADLIVRTAMDSSAVARRLIEAGTPFELAGAVLEGTETWAAKFYKGPYVYAGDLGRGFDVFRWSGEGPAPWLP